jgi:hypothetical protein
METMLFEVPFSILDWGRLRLWGFVVAEVDLPDGAPIDLEIRQDVDTFKTAESDLSIASPRWSPAGPIGPTIAPLNSQAVIEYAQMLCTLDMHITAPL